MNPIKRASFLNDKINKIISKDKIKWTFIPSYENSFISYFPENINTEFSQLNIGEYIHPKSISNETDLIICTIHGSDQSSFLFNIRLKAPNAIIAVWLFDNHLNEISNLRSILHADIILPSHRFASYYLPNPTSVLFSVLPACCCQWTSEEISMYFNKCKDIDRSNKLLVNYVDYELSSRSETLNLLKNYPDQVDAKIMQSHDRSRYFKKTRPNKFIEWVSYKCTVILPVKNDVSTRIFDALIAGTIPIVPKMLNDFDGVISPNIQKSLGIIRIDDISIDNVLKAIPKAIIEYDKNGIQGAQARHHYALNNHTLKIRIKNFLHIFLSTNSNQYSIKFISNENQVSGLYLTK